MKSRAVSWVLFLSTMFAFGSFVKAAPADHAKPTSAGAGTYKMNFKNVDLVDLIEFYSKISGKKMIMDPGVRGKISIFIQEPVTPDEAFNHLSSALALNGYAFTRKGDTLEIRSARNVQRDLIEVATELPALKPERMVTYIYTPKYLSVENLNRDLRIMSSKDGEMSVLPSNNQLILSDFVSNIHRVDAILKELDKPAAAKK